MSRLSFIIALLLSLMMAIPAVANTKHSEDTPLRRAAQTIHDIDANGQAFTLSIAALGGSAAIGFGGWTLYERPLEHHGNPSPVLFGSGLVMVGTGFGQFIHGFLRLGERRASAAIASPLLDDPKTSDEAFLQYLRMRADLSVSTRFVGAIITTLQGIAATTAGLDLALTKGSHYETSGWVITGLGIAGTGVGAIHFFGKTRAEKELEGALNGDKQTSVLSMEIGPSAVVSTRNSVVPGVSLRGTF